MESKHTLFIFPEKSCEREEVKNIARHSTVIYILMNVVLHKSLHKNEVIHYGFF